MPRKSLAEELYEDEEDCVDEDGHWIVVYDFEGKPNPRFWVNLSRLSTLGAGSRLLQFSVYMTGSRRIARVAVLLARHYGASVEVFRGGAGKPVG
jgi:hypothetical protein